MKLGWNNTSQHEIDILQGSVTDSALVTIGRAPRRRGRAHQTTRDSVWENRVSR